MIGCSWAQISLYLIPKVHLCRILSVMTSGKWELFFMQEQDKQQHGDENGILHTLNSSKPILSIVLYFSLMDYCLYKVCIVQTLKKAAR
jgi:hypothetical protein